MNTMSVRNAHKIMKFPDGKISGETFPGISGKCRENSRRENFRGKFPGNSGKFREIPGKFPTGKFPGKLSGKIPGKFIFSSAEFVKIREIG